MARIWKDSDVSLDPIKNQTIAILGYGIQGNAQANNLKDSGLNVIVGLQETGASWKKAKDDGHEVMSISKACEKADIVHVLIPDMVQAQVSKEEVETDWYGEQVDLCGGSATMIINAFETLVEAGYQPEIAYFEVLHELKLIVDMIQRYGIAGMYRRVSETARYGGLTRGPMVMD